MNIMDQTEIVVDPLVEPIKPKRKRKTPTFCCVPYCPTVYRSGGEPISFFRFPLNAIEKNRWMLLLRMRPKMKVTSKRVCMFHFKEDDFFAKGATNRRTLKKRVKPSQNLKLSPNEKKKTIIVRKERNLSDNYQHKIPSKTTEARIEPPLEPVEPPITKQEPKPLNAKEQFLNYLIEALARKTVENSQFEQMIDYLENEVQFLKKKNSNMAYVIAKIRDGEAIEELDKFLIVDDEEP